jgi:dipeptidyl aminopeptidase/acylaminoacyl peptidase
VFHGFLRYKTLVVIVSCFWGFLAYGETQTSPQSYQDFSALPAFEYAALSPSGTKIAFVRNDLESERSILMTMDLTTMKSQILLGSNNVQVKFNWYHWANDEDLLVSARYEFIEQGVRFYTTRLLTMKWDLADGKPHQLITWRHTERFGQNNYTPQFQDTVIDWLPDDPKHILMALDFSRPHEPSVFKVEVGKKHPKITRLIKGKRKIREWITNQQGEISLAKSYDYDSGNVEIYQVIDNTDYKLLFQYNAFTDKAITPLGFGLSPDILYYQKYKGEFKALYTLNLATGEETEILADDAYDVDGSLIYSQATREAIGVRHSNADGGRYYWQNPYAKLQASLDNILKDTQNTLVSFSQDDMQYIAYVQSDTQPGFYLYGDRVKGKITKLFDEYPNIDPKTLTPHKLVTYTARDNTEIEAYLTLPQSGEAPYPTVIFPHGGPNAREYSGFDYWVSYFTSQGYAVLRPNFRGSSGYGFSFSQAQLKQWGMSMQDDVVDGTQWMIDQGLADKQRMCIVGASYGGYVALAAAIKTPNMYQCAMSFAGVTDLDAIVRRSRNFLNSEGVERQMGEDSQEREARSPVNYADKIQIPILLIHGDEDRTVNVEQSRNMASKLEDLDKAVKYVELPAGDHYLSIQSNRTTLFKEMDAFLKENLSR